jgi:oligopeptide/dipeptide ABC transporter ATP-binding protein
VTTSALRDLVIRHPGQADQQPFLEVVDLRVHFPTDDGLVKSVDGLSFALDRGRTLGIVGESGSGKSVTSLAIMGLHTRSTSEQSRPGAKLSGEIFLEGEELLGKSPEYVRTLRGKKMAMIFQDPLSAMNPYYTVGHQIIEAYQIHNPVKKRVARQHAVDLLGRVGIPEPKSRVDAYPHQFSGGMRQRAMIAMALSCDPDLLIADEPTTALDVTVQAQIMELLADLQRERKMGLILITHDLGVVADVADKISVMYAGRIVEKAQVGDIYARPAHPYTKGLLESIPRLDLKGKDLSAIRGLPPSLTRIPLGCEFNPRCPYAQQICRDERPPLNEVVPGRYSACHFAQEVLDGTI